MGRRDTLIFGFCALFTGAFGVGYQLLYPDEILLKGTIVVFGFFAIVGAVSLWRFFKPRPNKS
jgi:hypothetical protein